MTEQITVTTERVDDIPLLMASIERLGLAELIDEHVTPHGNWHGLSVGKMLTGWLAHILSEADHRLNRVQDWAAKHIETLRGCLQAEVRALGFSDDRLASGLEVLADDARWAKLEAALNHRTLRVYDLQAKRVRIDSTTTSGYWEVTAEGLFQFGHSKDHRPDLPQVKVVLAALDPLGMPLVTHVVSGEKADDPLYIPAIEAVRHGVGPRGLLYVGDCKMMALETRAFLQAGGDKYLGPFSAVQRPPQVLEEYLNPLWAGKQALISVERPDAEGTIEKIAEGFECCETITAVVNGEEITWVERCLVVRSLAQAEAAETALHKRLQKAEQAIEALGRPRRGKKRPETAEALRAAAQAILKKYDVAGVLNVAVVEEVQERHVRKYGERAAETRLARWFSIAVQRDKVALEQVLRRLGWRVYGTNALAAELSLEQAVLAYREEYLIERSFGRLKGKPLTLSPMYLEDDRHATGLIRLLSIALRVLTLVEYLVRHRLAETGETLSGLYAGNAKRATHRPTGEAILQVFKDMFLSFVTLDGDTYRHLSPLSDLQKKILELLNLPLDIYTSLAINSAHPP
jgi:transposase